MIVFAPAPTRATAEQLGRRESGQPSALSGQVRMVGVPRLCGQVGHAGDPRTGSCCRLGVSEVALKPQGPLESFGSDANAGQEPPAQLTSRDAQLPTQGSDLGQPPRHQPAHGGRDKFVWGGSSRLLVAQEALQHLEGRQRVRGSR